MTSQFGISGVVAHSGLVGHKVLIDSEAVDFVDHIHVDDIHLGAVILNWKFRSIDVLTSSENGTLHAENELTRLLSF